MWQVDVVQCSAIILHGGYLQDNFLLTRSVFLRDISFSTSIFDMNGLKGIIFLFECYCGLLKEEILGENN